MKESAETAATHLTDKEINSSRNTNNQSQTITQKSGQKEVPEIII